MTQNKMNRTNVSPGSGRQIVAHYVGILFYIVQTLLVFRFTFKLLGANPSNRFVSLLYSATAPITSVFEGIFSEIMLDNYDMFHVFEPSSVIALIVTVIVAGLINRLLINRDTTPAVSKTTVKTEAQPLNEEEKNPDK